TRSQQDLDTIRVELVVVVERENPLSVGLPDELIPERLRAVPAFVLTDEVYDWNALRANRTCAAFTLQRAFGQRRCDHRDLHRASSPEVAGWGRWGGAGFCAGEGCRSRFTSCWFA